MRPLLSYGAADTKALSGAHAGLSALTVGKLEDIRHKALGARMKLLASLLFLIAPVAIASGTPWETYLSLPTPQHAALVKRISYTHPSEDGYNANDLYILQDQVLAKDPQAFRLAFRLYKSADGALAEELGVILGNTIRAHPSFFLEQVAKLHVPCSELHWPINAAGYEYVDRPRASNYEIRMRAVALKNVKQAELRKVQAECLKQIDSP